MVGHRRTADDAPLLISPAAEDASHVIADDDGHQPLPQTAIAQLLKRHLHAELAR